MTTTTEASKTEIWFYHLTRTRLQDVLPKLLLKTLDREKTSIILCASESMMDMLNDYLWSYDEESFLPHGSAKEPYPAEQLIYLTTTEENPNQASMLFIVEGSEPSFLRSFERVIYLFDQRDGQMLTQARNYWKKLKEEGWNLSYWQQKPEGGWEKTATANEAA